MVQKKGQQSSSDSSSSSNESSESSSVQPASPSKPAKQPVSTKQPQEHRTCQEPKRDGSSRRQQPKRDGSSKRQQRDDRSCASRPCSHATGESTRSRSRDRIQHRKRASPPQSQGQSKRKDGKRVDHSRDRSANKKRAPTPQARRPRKRDERSHSGRARNLDTSKCGRIRSRDRREPKKRATTPQARRYREQDERVRSSRACSPDIGECPRSHPLDRSHAGKRAAPPRSRSQSNRGRSKRDDHCPVDRAWNQHDDRTRSRERSDDRGQAQGKDKKAAPTQMRALANVLSVIKKRARQDGFPKAERQQRSGVSEKKREKCAHPLCKFAVHSDAKVSTSFCCGKCGASFQKHPGKNIAHGQRCEGVFAEEGAKPTRQWSKDADAKADWGFKTGEQAWNWDSGKSRGDWEANDRYRKTWKDPHNTRSSDDASNAGEHDWNWDSEKSKGDWKGDWKGESGNSDKKSEASKQRKAKAVLGELALSPEEIEKRRERAARFGIVVPAEPTVVVKGADDSSVVACSHPNCIYAVHSDSSVCEKFCCKACASSFETDPNGKADAHGKKCEKKVMPPKVSCEKTTLGDTADPGPADRPDKPADREETDTRHERAASSGIVAQAEPTIAAKATADEGIVACSHPNCNYVMHSDSSVCDKFC
eukprot:TRINITY_DN58521_c0_g1_i1.p1 TRINITY_DN58521_c0_g1~~TRINITY_DN58521_c0_g1_i1.p1  ORF type:complete len:650 (-),score=93.80 TRINITY_DN58521_c0_g1_i1:508-2457(-)